MSELDTDLEDNQKEKIKEAISIFQTDEWIPSWNEIYRNLVKPPKPPKTKEDIINIGSETSSNKIHPIVRLPSISAWINTL